MNRPIIAHHGHDAIANYVGQAETKSQGDVQASDAREIAFLYATVSASKKAKPNARQHYNDAFSS